MGKTRRYIPHWADDENDKPKKHKGFRPSRKNHNSNRDRWSRGFDKHQPTDYTDPYHLESKFAFRSRNHRRFVDYE